LRNKYPLKNQKKKISELSEEEKEEEKKSFLIPKLQTLTILHKKKSLP